mmetsp:Transcript_55513/g.127647  ORF Transcript_55513/g.127647 Transcript_55513/m.127647 type:complete len:602 (+) Transcript_55513:439-2244(+)
MLSYIATTVVSAISAGQYMISIADPNPKDQHTRDVDNEHVIYIAIALIVAFAILKLFGMSESAVVAAGMFIFHLTTMAILWVSAVVYCIMPHGEHGVFGKMVENLKFNAEYTFQDHTPVLSDMVMGFASAMLGVSGFESSANFVEEQAEGVFPKTLRNMWVAVTILNISFSVLCLCCTKLDELKPEADYSLAYLGKVTAGDWLKLWVSIDAFIVLAAAVLTSYVGIGGLASRMGGDRVLPMAFMTRDQVPTILFGAICIALVLSVNGNSQKLGACYTFAFLVVMILFAMSLFVLQTKRPKLPRAMQNNPVIPALAALLVLIALITSIVSNASVLPVFALYWGVLLFVVGGFMYRLKLVQFLAHLARLCRCCPSGYLERSSRRIRQEASVVYFTKSANICRLNKALMYVRQNEDTDHVRVVHVFEDEKRIPKNLVSCVGILDTIYPSVKVDLMFIQGTFGPAVIQNLSVKLGIPPNLMFITCPTSQEFNRRLENLKGVRVITGYEEEDALEESVMMSFADLNMGDKGLPSPGRSLATGEDGAGVSISALLAAGVARAEEWGRDSSTPVAGASGGFGVSVELGETSVPSGNTGGLSAGALGSL